MGDSRQAASSSRSAVGAPGEDTVRGAVSELIDIDVSGDASAVVAVPRHIRTSEGGLFGKRLEGEARDDTHSEEECLS